MFSLKYASCGVSRHEDDDDNDDIFVVSTLFRTSFWFTLDQSFFTRISLLQATTITKLVEFLAGLPDEKQEGIGFLIFHMIRPFKYYVTLGGGGVFLSL